MAVKVPHLRYESDPSFYSRFQREEQIGQKLDHPFILRFLPVESPKAVPTSSRSISRGSTLFRDSVPRLIPFRSTGRDSKIASLLCEALHHMHARGVIHRDLKPENIMISCDGTMRLMDFGIASDAAARGASPCLDLPRPSGLPDYMAPEQVCSKPTDERTEISTLGAVLYAMLTGSTSFPSDNPWVTMNHRVQWRPVRAAQMESAPVPRRPRKSSCTPWNAIPPTVTKSAARRKLRLDPPATVRVTGYCDRLAPPRLRLGFRETPVSPAPLLCPWLFISCQVLLFLFLSHHLGRH